MKKLKLILMGLLMSLTFVGCGSDDSPLTSLKSFDLKDTLKNNTFYVVRDNAYSKATFTVEFDENLTSWDVALYDPSYSTQQGETGTQDINVTDSKIIVNSSSEWSYSEHNDDYINFSSKSSPLSKLKLFNSKDTAMQYYNKSLKDEVKDQTYYAVQNNLTARALFKFAFDSNATFWDVTTYGSNYDENNITGTYANINVTLQDSNLTDSGGTTYHFNSQEEDYISLINTANQYHTLKLYDNKEDALSYYNSYDLRDELRESTKYAVSDDGTSKTLLTMDFNSELSSYDLTIYSEDYNTIVSERNSTIITQEDRYSWVFQQNDQTYSLTYIVENTTDDFIELKGPSETLRLYSSDEKAFNYFKE